MKQKFLIFLVSIFLMGFEVVAMGGERIIALEIGEAVREASALNAMLCRPNTEGKDQRYRLCLKKEGAKNAVAPFKERKQAIKRCNRRHCKPADPTAKKSENIPVI